jgi:hypothetical protein
MKCKYNPLFLIGIFVQVDEIHKLLQDYLSKRALSEPNLQLPQARRKPRMTDVEIATILIYYHHSGYKNFQYYYQHLVSTDLISYFPNLVSYNRFIELIPRVQYLLVVHLSVTCATSQRTHKYYIDSKKLPACHIKRSYSHKVFKHTARKGKTSVGWFYGHKLHLIINPLGEIVNLYITSGNVADNDKDVLDNLFDNLTGKVFGDKGYLTKNREMYREAGVEIVTKFRSNMKNKLMDYNDKLWLRSRGVIESVFDIMTSVLDIEHTRHRSPVNASCHLMAGLIAYTFIEDKPRAILANMAA